MKNYRVMRLANACHYPGVQQDYFRVNPNWSKQSYAEQKAVWDSQFYVYGDSFSHWMKRLGNEATDVVVDAVPLQSWWAMENGIDTSVDSWRLDTVLAQIGKYRPDVVYLQDVHAIPPGLRKNLKQIFPFLRAVVIFRGYPGGSLSYFADFCDADLLLVGTPRLIDRFAQLGRKAHLAHHSFDHRINRFLKVDPMGKESVPFSFVGTLGFGSAEHDERARLLNFVSDASPLTIFSDDPWNRKSAAVQPVETMAWLMASIIRNPVTRWMAPHILKRKHLFPIPVKAAVKKLIARGKLATQQFSDKTIVKPGVHGLMMYQTLANSKISLNVHSNAGKGMVDNMRMFQAPGVGSCLLTDWGSNLPELFEPDKEVVCYKTHEECVDKLKQLLSNENLRAEIARNGRARVLRDHTAEKRVAQIHDYIQTVL